MYVQFRKSTWTYISAGSKPSDLTESDLTDARTLAEPGHQAAAPWRSLVAKVDGRFSTDMLCYLVPTLYLNTYILRTYIHTYMLIIEVHFCFLLHAFIAYPVF